MISIQLYFWLAPASNFSQGILRHVYSKLGSLHYCFIKRSRSCVLYPFANPLFVKSLFQSQNYILYLASLFCLSVRSEKALTSSSSAVSVIPSVSLSLFLFSLR